MAKTDKNYLKKDELERFWNLLLQKRGQLLSNVGQMESEVAKKNDQDLGCSGSTMPTHMADIGSDNFETDFTISLIGGERKILEQINAALKRIKDGKYGICLGTGKPISKKRLEALPWTKYSIEYATLIEKGLAQEIDESWE